MATANVVEVRAEEISARQLREFWKQTAGQENKPPRIHGENFQRFIECPDGYGLLGAIPLADKGIPEPYRQYANPWRKMMDKECKLKDSGISIAYRLPPGLTLKQHARYLGPCVQDFRYLQNWQFEDTSTVDSVAFWISGLLTKSTGKTVRQQLEFLGELREKYKLPAHHLTGFGKVGELAPLMLAHFQRSGQRVPLDGLWVRTDTLGAGRRRLVFQFCEGGLYCDCWRDDGDAYVTIGCFALGVEVVGH